MAGVMVTDKIPDSLGDIPLMEVTWSLFPIASSQACFMVAPITVYLVMNFWRRGRLDEAKNLRS